MLDSLDTLIAFALIFTVISLIVTVAVQMITSVANLRGKNAAWGLAETFETITPELAAKVKGKGKILADHLLKDPLLSDNQIGPMVNMASAVRADELFDLLQRIATGRKQGTPGEIKGHVITLLTSLGVDRSVFENATEKIRELTEQKQSLESLLNRLPDGVEKGAVQAVVAEVTRKLKELAGGGNEAAVRWLAQGEFKIQHIYQQFEHWFDTGQERAHQWFSSHAWWVTLVFSVVAALLLQLDTFEIFRFVSSNRELRDKLVAQSAGLLKQADHVLSDTKEVLTTALENWRAALKPADKIPAELKTLKPEPGDTMGTLVAKVEAALQGVETREAWLKSFGEAIDTAAKSALNQKTGDYRSLATSLDNTGFDLFPKGWRWKEPAEQKPGEPTPEPAAMKNQFCSHLPGMLCSILLLSLGAPFWFNVLKSMASLRSSVAGNISDEKKVEQKSGEAGKPGNPPPTVLPKPTL